MGVTVCRMDAEPNFPTSVDGTAAAQAISYYDPAGPYSHSYLHYLPYYQHSSSIIPSIIIKPEQHLTGHYW